MSLVLLYELLLVYVFLHLLQYILIQIFLVKQNLIDMLELLYHVLMLFLFVCQFLVHRMLLLLLLRRMVFLILLIFLLIDFLLFPTFYHYQYIFLCYFYLLKIIYIWMLILGIQNLFDILLLLILRLFQLLLLFDQVLQINGRHFDTFDVLFLVHILLLNFHI